MKKTPLRIYRLLSLVSISLLVVFSFSCKKEEAESTNPPSGPGGQGGGGGSYSIIATADLNFVELGKAFDFKCYDKNPEVNHITIKNDTLYMIFGNNQTVEGDTVVSQIIVSGVQDLEVGDTYSVDDNTSRLVTFSMYANNAPELGYTALNKTGAPFNNSGELKIISKNGNKIKATFYFSGYTFPNPMNPGVPQKEVIVSNGTIDCEYIIE